MSDYLAPVVGRVVDKRRSERLSQLAVVLRAESREDEVAVGGKMLCDVANEAFGVVQKKMCRNRDPDRYL